jgi:hypothetical protein
VSSATPLPGGIEGEDGSPAGAVPLRRVSALLAAANHTRVLGTRELVSLDTEHSSWAAGGGNTVAAFLGTVTIREATRMLGIKSENYVRRLIKAGTLEAELTSQGYDVDVASVQRYLSERNENLRRRPAGDGAAPSHGQRPRTALAERFP